MLMLLGNQLNFVHNFNLLTSFNLVCYVGRIMRLVLRDAKGRLSLGAMQGISRVFGPTQFRGLGVLGLDQEP